MAQHSKGPWVATGWEGIVVNDADGNTLTLAPGGGDLARMQANARLIAAAPALLAALETMRDRVMRFPSRAWAELTSNETVAFNVALDRAVDAIRAATGEE